MNLARALLSASVRVFWPARCAACDAALPGDDAVFCAACALALNPILAACPGCALPWLGRTACRRGTRCPACTRTRFGFSGAWAGFEYGATLATAIVRLKHGGRPDLARPLGRLLAGTVTRAIDPRHGPFIEAILPVPLHPAKLRLRGFNQAVELGRVVLGHLRTTSASNAVLPALERRLLLRVKKTRELGRSGPGARRLEVSGAFAVADRARVAGRRFLVLDDVMTTGATLNACAETLVRAGAAEVRVAALARAVT